MRHMIFALLAVAIPGCAYPGITPGPDASAVAAPAASVVGTWHLVTVNEQPIPHSPLHEGRPVPVEITASTFSISADGTFTMTMTYRNRSDGGTFARDFEGTYTAAADGFRFDWKNAGATRVWLQDDRLMMDNEGTVFAYAR
jgi:hypothetical protein